MKYKYPCTGNIGIEGFGEYLEKNITTARRNIGIFSKELQAKFGVPYISLVNSGSSANLVAAMAMAEKIKNDGKPLKAAISAFTFPSTASALILAGFSLVAVDVAPGGFNMDPEKLSQAMDGVSLVVPTHFLGFPADIERIISIAHENGAYVIQDACETLSLANSKGEQYFTYGDINTWSFYHPHHISSYGGGAIITLDKADAMLVDSICHWGRACKCHIDPTLCEAPEGPAHQFTYERTGVNVEMSELNACFGRWQFEHFEEYEEKRIKNYNMLFSVLKDNPAFELCPQPDIKGSLFVFPVSLKNGMNIMDAYRILAPQGVEIRTLMGGVISEQPAYRFINSKNLKNAKETAEKTFFVGIHQTLTEENVKAVGDIINSSF